MLRDDMIELLEKFGGGGGLAKSPLAFHAKKGAPKVTQLLKKYVTKAKRHKGSPESLINAIVRDLEALKSN